MLRFFPSNVAATGAKGAVGIVSGCWEFQSQQNTGASAGLLAYVQHLHNANPFRWRPGSTSLENSGKFGRDWSQQFDRKIPWAVKNADQKLSDSFCQPIVRMQDCSNQTTVVAVASLSASFPFSPLAGDAILLAIVADQAITSVVDNQTGNTYTLVSSVVVGTGTLSLYLATQISVGGTFTITVNVSPNAHISMSAVDYYGVDKGNPQLMVQTNSGTGTTASTAALTGVAANQLYFSAVAFGNAATGNSDTSTGMLQIDNIVGSGTWRQAASDLNKGPTTLTPQWFLGSSVAWGEISVVIGAVGQWIDSALAQLGSSNVLTLSLSDSLNSPWQDSLIVGYGDGINDTLTIVDIIGAGFGLVTADSMTMSDAMNLVLGLNFSFSDTMSMSDALIIGFGQGIVETLVFIDSSGVGYGLVINDTMTMSDSFQLAFVLLLTLTDNLNNWNDALGVGYGNAVVDQMSMSDFMGAGYGSATSDQLVIVDSVSSGYGALLSDNMNNWADAFQMSFVILLALVDNLNNWSDSLAIGYGLLPVDQMLFSDSMAAGFGALTSDQLVLVDSSSAGYGLQLQDQMSFSDLLVAGFGVVLSDQLVFVDSLGSEYGLLLGDSLNSWQDLFSFQLINAGILQLNLNLSDSMNNWQDALAYTIFGFRGVAIVRKLITQTKISVSTLAVSSKNVMRQVTCTPKAKVAGLAVAGKTIVRQLTCTPKTQVASLAVLS